MESYPISPLPSGKPLHSYGKSPCSRGKSTINGACSISNSHYQRLSPKVSYESIHEMSHFTYFFPQLSTSGRHPVSQTPPKVQASTSDLCAGHDVGGGRQDHCHLKGAVHRKSSSSIYIYIHMSIYFASVPVYVYVYVYMYV